MYDIKATIVKLYCSE